MHTSFPNNGWHVIAELNIYIEADFESRIQTWMCETMCVLGVDQGQLNRMLKSTLEAISKSEYSSSNEVNSPLIHLRAYIPSGIPIKSETRRNWGFFRMDKHGVILTESDYVDHLIELYLYLEE